MTTQCQCRCNYTVAHYCLSHVQWTQQVNFAHHCWRRWLSWNTKKNRCVLYTDTKQNGHRLTAQIPIQAIEAVIRSRRRAKMRQHRRRQQCRNQVRLRVTKAATVQTRVGHGVDPSMHWTGLDWIGCDDCDSVLISKHCSTVHDVSFKLWFMNF